MNKKKKRKRKESFGVDENETPTAIYTRPILLYIQLSIYNSKCPKKIVRKLYIYFFVRWLKEFWYSIKLEERVYGGLMDTYKRKV